ncbi:hypothetical protein Sjap_015200 [Stephania japonica]|uniref:Glycosyl hydrolase family 13 catalytic domain-containing protein n=1 Tax=Stephania japonica TaxID=461633 RepID=A0AAP0IJR3_9MAGN
MLSNGCSALFAPLNALQPIDRLRFEGQRHSPHNRCFSSRLVSMGSKSSKSRSGFPDKADRGRRLPVSNVYDRRRAAESVIQEEAPQLLEIGPTLEVSPGKAFPFGATEAETGINFSLFSQHASAVTLCLSIPQRGNLGEMEAGMVQLTLNPKFNKTGNGLPRQGVLYGYRIDGPRGWEQGHRYDNNDVLLDPYAKLVEGRKYFGDVTHKMSKFLGKYDFASLPFDWGNDYEKPNIPENVLSVGHGLILIIYMMVDTILWFVQKDLVLYEMNVRAFTSDESSGLHPDIRGSYLGVVEKIPHLLELGINAVELLPVFEFDELEFQRRPNPRDHMINTWGYSTMNFFAPMSRYASVGGGPEAASLEFKQMVKSLHAAGIKVILDVVYNHTNEADDRHPYTTSFRGIDNKHEVGNTLNCNHPVVMELILESLRHWVTEYHVDGFRFDLASVLCRGIDGSPLDSPPIIKAIAKDHILSSCKLIAEPWDCDGLYLVGRFPNWDRWAEWNGRYRDDIRKVHKGGGDGDLGMKGSFATRVAGSSDLYKVNKRKPCHSINFVIAHDGFTLNDLVSYNFKHNEANGEGGNDGGNDNFSWNCGHEGENADSAIKALRARQMKNFHVALMTSQSGESLLSGAIKEKRESLPPHRQLLPIIKPPKIDSRVETLEAEMHELPEQLNKIPQLEVSAAKVSLTARSMLPTRKTDHPSALWSSQFQKGFECSRIRFARSGADSEECERLDSKSAFGTPMMLMGDEYGHTRFDGRKINLESSSYNRNDVTWHEDNWDNEESKFLAFTLHDHMLGEDIYLAFNAHDYFVKLALPAPPSQRSWSRVVDTNLESPHDFVPEGVLGIESSYNMAPFSSILLLAKQ